MTKISDQVRYFFDQDDSGHNYLVRVDRRADWRTWLEICDGSDPDQAIARRIDGVEAWTFTDPQAVQ